MANKLVDWAFKQIINLDSDYDEVIGDVEIESCDEKLKNILKKLVERVRQDIIKKAIKQIKMQFDKYGSERNDGLLDAIEVLKELKK